MTRSEEYQLYLKSAEWKTLRKKVIKRDGGKCVKCNSRSRLTVHHIQYPEHLGTEPLEYMQTLCEDCHNILHGGSPRKKEVKKKVQASTRRRKHKLRTDKTFAKTVRLSSPVKVFSQDEINRYLASQA